MVARPAAVVVRIYREAERGLAYEFAVQLDNAPGWDAGEANRLYWDGPANLRLDPRISGGRRGAPGEDRGKKEQNGSHVARTYHTEKAKDCPTPKDISDFFRRVLPPAVTGRIRRPPQVKCGCGSEWTEAFFRMPFLAKLAGLGQGAKPGKNPMCN